MAKPRVEFLFDFGSPNAYLSHLVIPAIEKRQDMKFEYLPVLLGGVYKLTNNRSPAESLAGIKNKPQYQQIETERFIRQHGIKSFRSNPFFPVNTLMIMRGAVAAKKLGLFERYVDEVYRHMWCEPKKLDDPAILRAALLESSLPADRLFELVQTAEVKETSCWPRRSAPSSAARSGRRPSSSATRSISARTGCATSKRRSPTAGKGEVISGAA